MTSLTQQPVQRTIQVAGGAVRIRHGGAGPPLVILHHDIGNPGWLRFHELLAEDFTVYVPDIPGYGQSDRPQWARNVRDLVALLHLTLDELDFQDVVLVGLGYGGWLAAELATTAQRRFTHLVLVGAAGIQPRDGEIVDQFLIAHEEYVKLGFHDPANFTRQFGEIASDEQLVEWDICREITTRVAWQPYMFNRALPELLKSVRTPTLVVWGSDDRIVPLVCGEQYVETLPAARLVTIHGSGHFVEMEEPVRLAELVAEHAATARG